MTATVGDGIFEKCSDKERMLSTAYQLASEVGVQPLRCFDSGGREFLRICSAHVASEQSIDEVEALIGRFFEIYDTFGAHRETGDDNLRIIYDSLSIDDSGSEIYLSDGVWLGSDGSLHDRGR